MPGKETVENLCSALNLGVEAVTRIYSKPSQSHFDYVIVVNRLAFLSRASKLSYLDWGATHQLTLTSKIEQLTNQYLKIIPQEDWAILLVLMQDESVLQYWKASLSLSDEGDI